MMGEHNKNLHNDAQWQDYENARRLRKELTSAEDLLWQNLRGKKLDGSKFRRRHAFSFFILDFYCHEAKRVIELDGKVHNEKFNKLYDEARTLHLNNEGLKVIRFRNEEVLKDVSQVLSSIQKYLSQTNCQ